MKLSILIPMYNASEHIGNCLDSLLNQDIPKEDYEIIVMDDGSTDDSTEIVKGYVERSENVILHIEENSGCYSTRNKLLKLARGEYIYNLDADDYIVYRSLKKIISTAKQHDVDILGFNSISTTEVNLFSSNTKNEVTDVTIYNGIEFLSKRKYLNITVWWYIIKRDFIIKNKICFEIGNPMEDGPFTLRTFLKANRIIHLKMDIHRYVQVPTSIMNNENRDHLNKMIENYIDLIPRYNSLIVDISKRHNPNLHKVIDNIKYRRDVNVYFMFFKMIKSNISIVQINKILNEFKSLKAYPITQFIGEEYNQKKFIISAYIFNHKTLFYFVLYPIRIMYRLKLINLP